MAAHEQSEDSFGFRSVKPSAEERIRNIRPSVPQMPFTDLSRVDAVADTAGFVSRERAHDTVAAGRIGARRSEPRNALNMRVPVSLGEAFQRFCQENRYSYPEGLEEIMKRAGLPVD